MGAVRRDAKVVLDAVGPRLLVTAVVAATAAGALIGMVKEASSSYRRAYGTVPPRSSAPKR